MTAGSYCFIGPQGIVHGTTVFLLLKHHLNMYIPSPPISPFLHTHTHTHTRMHARTHTHTHTHTHTLAHNNERRKKIPWCRHSCWEGIRDIRSRGYEWSTSKSLHYCWMRRCNCRGKRNARARKTCLSQSMTTQAREPGSIA